MRRMTCTSWHCACQVPVVLLAIYEARVMMVLKPPIHCNENSNSNLIYVLISSVYTSISFQLYYR